MTVESTAVQPYVVAIGASAGGLVALELLISNLPVARDGVVYIVIQHLSPKYESRLDSILARTSPLPVRFLDERTALEVGWLYLVRPRTQLRIESFVITSLPQDDQASPGRPIDDTMAELARVFGARAVGIVLSGTGSDGSEGLRQIKAAGGLCLVQDPETAKFDGMPRNAIGTGVVDAVDSCECLGKLLGQYLEKGDLDKAPKAGEGGGSSMGGDAEIDEIYTRLRIAFGVDFHAYKSGTVLRRIHHRLTLNEVPDLRHYLLDLDRNPDELALLFDDLLIGVTNFFRDPPAFDQLYEQVILPQLSDLAPDSEYRCWVEACSTGEEAYSLAMLIDKGLTALGKPMRVKIFATDASSSAISVAAEGVYPVDAVSQIPEPFRSRHFVDLGNGLFRVASDLRGKMVFYPHDILENQPYARIHLVLCRNMLIYLNDNAQRAALKKLTQALVPGGRLMVGSSETIGSYADLFEAVDRQWRIYRKPLLGAGKHPKPKTLPGTTPEGGHPLVTGDAKMARAYDLILDKLIHCGILVDAEGNILHVFGHVDEFVRIPVGRPVLDIQSALAPELRLPVADAVAQAKRGRQPVVCRRLAMEGRDRRLMLDVRVDPFFDKPSAQTWLLVAFDDQTGVSEVPESRRSKSLSATEKRVHQLEQELNLARESLNVTIEELGASNEELLASNEELLASNEQLQSINEELHSLNEELHSVNVESEHKLRELNTATADLSNMILASNVGIVFLDTQGAIRLFTAESTRFFNLMPQDVGRNIRHITSLAIDDNLGSEIEDVKASGQMRARRVATSDGALFLRKISPYFDTNGKSAGIIISLFEITELIHAQIQLAVERQANKAKAEFVANVSHELRTPLNVVLGLAQLLHEERLSKRARGYVDELRVAGEGLLSVINDILDFEKADAGKMALELYRFSIGELLSTAQTYLSSLCQQKGIAYRTVSELNDLTQVYVGDAGKIQRVLINLIGNAVKFTEQGEVCLSIAQDQRESGIQWMRFIVEDTGIGMDPSKLETIFQPFTQMDSGTQRRFGGTGLGLSICKAIITLMGGRISVVSNPGKGTTFTVVLPLENATHENANDVRPFATKALRRRPGVVAANSKLLGKTLLIVDDHEPNRSFMRRIFERVGMHVVEAENGEVCVRQVQEGQHFDIILMDIQMPVMGGLEATRIIHGLLGEHCPPIVAVTAGVLGVERMQALEAGVIDFVPKPIDAQQTMSLIENLIGEAQVCEVQA